MRRFLCLFGGLILPLLVLAEDQPARAPNSLTREEIQAGKLLLFDGESTFGWRISGDARVEGGVLILGGSTETTAETSLQVQSGSVYLECDWQGEKPPTILWNNPFEPKLTLKKDRQGKWTKQASSSFGGKSARPAVGIQVPAGSKLLLRTIKFTPVGLQPLFNGKDLTGWKTLEMRGKKSHYTVTKEGWLNIKDGPGDIQTEKTFGDFLLQLECISNGKHLNSGIFFRAIPGQTWQGYEAQIRNQFTETPMQKYTIEEYDPTSNKLIGKKTIEGTAVDFGTGAIYRRVPARKGIARDGEWLTMTVSARGRHLATWVNGIQVVDWTDNRADNENPRQGYRGAAGVISIQGHDPTTDLSFRNLRAVELPKGQ